MTERILSTGNSLFDFAVSCAASKGFEFGEGARDFLGNRATTAELEIKKLSGEKRALKRREAEANFEKLIDEMILARDRIPGYVDRHPGVIGEQTLGDALGKLCPLWPFC